jgi:hypothetical protein
MEIFENWKLNPVYPYLLGSRHINDFDRQYCDKKIKRYSDNLTIFSHRFQWPTRVSSKNNKMYLALTFFQEINLASRNLRLKIIKKSFYLCIEILYVKLAHVTRVLERLFCEYVACNLEHKILENCKLKKVGNWKNIERLKTGFNNVGNWKRR